ncbi:MAG: calcium-binding protein [Amaricoccus sp.]|uniref:calcium-binding protein n=1 Tax=Amaricoccus sp. TaxID=1872485 RepID=UPI0039E58AC8
MARIYIEEHPLRVVGDVTDTLHLYLVYRGDNGAEYVVRSGPTDLLPYGGPMEIEVNVPIDESADSRDGESPADRHATLLRFPGHTADEAWGIIVKYAQALSDDDYPYRLFQTNSNAFAGAMVKAAGGFPALSLPDGIDRSEAVGYGYWKEIVGDVAPPADGTIVGTAKADVLAGIQIADVLTGLTGADRLFGASGDDRLFGGAGDDRLAGQGGSDALRGGLGDDTLLGGAGSDRLLGGAGADVFQFGGGDGRDTVADFQSGTDSLLMRVAGVDSVSDLHISQAGDDVRIGYGSGAIFVEDTQVADILPADIHFAQDSLLA